MDTSINDAYMHLLTNPESTSRTTMNDLYRFVLTSHIIAEIVHLTRRFWSLSQLLVDNLDEQQFTS
jgi:hypothetical protein